MATRRPAAREGEAPAEPRHWDTRARAEPASPHPHVPTLWPCVAAGVVLTASGFLGLDRWFYEHVSLVLNTESQPLDRDLYHVTKPFWLLWRYLFGHVLGALAFYVVGLLTRPQRWRLYTAALVGVAVAALVANTAQGAIGRLRPNQAESHLTFTRPLAELFTKENVSFPSGEAATAFALAWVLSRLLRRWRLAWYAGATLAAAARLVNGAHYISDVAAGALLGTLLATLVFGGLNKTRFVRAYS